MRLTALTLAAVLTGAAAAPTNPQMLSDVSSTLNDYNFAPDRAGRTAVFARSEADFAKARIFVVTKTDGQWSKPTPIDFTDPRYSDSDPWLTPDGQTLYFVSNRPIAGEAAKADLDIWRSTRAPGGWSAPEHLAAVSSPGPELGVELHGGVLYFSSVRKGGKGGLDIYAARQAGTTFEAPALVEGPFNSAKSDSDFTLSRDGRRAAFWRTVDGKGVLHLAHRTKRGWSEPEILPAAFNPGKFNFTPSFTPDGKSLWFASTAAREGQAAGMADIFIAKLPRAARPLLF